jgi:hypothetical protein
MSKSPPEQINVRINQLISLSQDVQVAGNVLASIVADSGYTTEQRELASDLQLRARYLAGHIEVFALGTHRSIE